MFQAFLQLVLLATVAQADNKYILGCLGGCIYQPQNIVQLQACATIGQQNVVSGGSSLNNFFSCQTYSTPTECNAKRTSPDQHECAWIDIPDRFSAYGKGTCVTNSVKILVQKGFGLIYKGYETLGKQHGIKFPIAQHQAECLQHSWNQTACVAASDFLGEKCGWCEGIDTEVFRVNPPTTGVCFQSSLVEGACELLKDNPAKKRCFNAPPDAASNAVPTPKPVTTTAKPKPVTTIATLKPVTVTTPKPVTATTTPKPVTTTKPKPVATTTIPKPVTTTKPKPVATTTTPKPVTTTKPKPTTTPKPVTTTKPKPVTTTTPKPVTTTKPKTITTTKPKPVATTTTTPKPVTTTTPKAVATTTTPKPVAAATPKPITTTTPKTITTTTPKPVSTTTTTTKPTTPKPTTPKPAATTTPKPFATTTTPKPV